MNLSIVRAIPRSSRPPSRIFNRSNAEFQPRNRTVVHAQSQSGGFQQLLGGRFGGNQGYSGPLWGSGPREPQRHPDFASSEEPISLFVDNIPKGMSINSLKNLFANHGEVQDAFISIKARKHTRARFGFVRF